MATVYITEYDNAAKDGKWAELQIAQEPAVVHQTVTPSAGGAQSNAFNADTVYVRICADANVLIGFGDDPQSADAGTFLVAGVVEYFGIRRVSKVICKTV